VSAPPVQYASNGDIHIAYQVLGDGPLDLVAGSGIEFADRGVHELKGIPGEWRLYAAN
jgi:hypothetical protein